MTLRMDHEDVVHIVDAGTDPVDLGYGNAVLVRCIGWISPRALKPLPPTVPHIPTCLRCIAAGATRFVEYDTETTGLRP